MRSRYTAYVKQQIDYLIATWHPDCQAEQWRESIAQSVNATEWKGLIVIAEEKGSCIDEGYVEFIAHFSDKETEHGIIHERSRFLCLEQRWYYIDGNKPQVGRNAVCRCGSGKKYKKCCGQ